MAQTREEILSQNAGVVACRRARSTRTLVTLYRTGEAEIGDPRPHPIGDGPYGTVCEPHGGVVFHDSLKKARSWLSHPEDWCPSCQEARA